MPPQERWRSGDGLVKQRGAFGPAQSLFSRRVEGQRSEGRGAERPKAGRVEIPDAGDEWSDELLLGLMHPEEFRLLRAGPRGAGPQGIAAVRGPGGLIPKRAQVIIAFSERRKIERVRLVGPPSPDWGG